MFDRSCVVVLFAIAVTVSAAGEESLSQPKMDKAVAAMEGRLPAIVRLKETAPEDYVNAMQAWIDDFAHIEEKYASVSQSYGVWHRALMEWMKLADYARTKLHSPERAIAIYRHAEAQSAKEQPRGSGLALHEQIADVYEFDLNDRAAAAATFRQLRDASASLPRETRADYAAWREWKRKWLDAEIAFLENGRRFEGSLTAPDLTGFQQQIYFGVGIVTTNGEVDASLNPFEVPDRLPTATREKLLSLPGSHTTFLHTWVYAVRLESAADARMWIERNDRAGFWTASLLTLAAVVDAMGEKERGDPKRDVGAMIVRTPTGQVTGLAILGREYAKRHALPVIPTPRPTHR